MRSNLQLKRLKIEGIDPVEPSVARFDLYYYIHSSRADLAPKLLEAVFQEMQATGELKSIRERVIAELMRRAAEGLPVCDDDYACFEPSGTEGG